MKLLKTNFYSENEVPFLLLNLKECYDCVDKFIAYEFNYTKSGLKKSFVDLNNYWNLFEEYSDKFEYHMINLDDDEIFIKEDNGIDESIQKTINEPYSRNYFTKLTSLDDNDYIFSVDADEIIYGNSYSKLIEQVDDLDSSVRIRMHFFWNGINHLTSKPWISPIVCKYKHLKNSCQKTSFGVTNYPQWRDDGSDSNEISGCHFSNCYANKEQFEYRKKAIYYKPTSLDFTKINLTDSIMPESIKDLESVFEEFGLS